MYRFKKHRTTGKNIHKNKFSTCKRCWRAFETKFEHSYCVTCFEHINKIFCKQCKKEWNKSISLHCSECCDTYDKKLVHCCTCGISYDTSKVIHCSECCFMFDNSDVVSNTNLTHCCTCETSWDQNIEKHCDICCRIYDNKLTHCCACKTYWDNSSDKIMHCCICEISWDLNLSYHCNICCNVYDIGSKHCCECEVTWNTDEKNHCDKCCNVYDQNLDHCCKCRKIWNPNKKSHCCGCKKLWNLKKEYHCVNCCVVHDCGLSHCCACKQIYDKKKQNHCNGCCITYDDRNFIHCCKCKKEWNPTNETHCKKCCKNCSHNIDHCCKCKKEWNPTNKTHCEKCCIIHDNEFKHCCLCSKIHNKNNKCDCDEIIKIIQDITIKHLSQYTNTARCVSKCLNLTCNSVKKFISAVVLYGTSGVYTVLDFFKDNNNYIFAYHGTPTLQSAMNICCESWDISKRTRQIHGSGEYFSTNFITASEYAGINGCVILSMIVNIVGTCEIKVVNKDCGEKWYIVDNVCNMSYALPIAVISTDQNINSYKLCPIEEKKILFERIIKNQNCKIQFYDASWIDYDDETIKQFIEYINQRKINFTITVSNGHKYCIDLNDMTQTNTASSYKRSIRIL